ncbi:Gti1/Pac2 family-domain-containing protein [Lactarius psammicola]|nr:Gti1/Pac2 family-domain-containing protein [Lactarius psammicola]
MMPPTCTNIRVRTARDAEIIFHAVRVGILPMVVQRLGSEERMALCSGCVYVWEERNSGLSESMEQGIERFTEGRSWGPSRARDDFLFYHEKDTAPKSLMVERTRAIRYQEDPVGASAMRPRRRGEHMIKQTYSVYVQTTEGMKKWHLNAYWTQEDLDQLSTVDDFPELRSLDVPPGHYLCARTNRMRETVARSARGNAFPTVTPPRLYTNGPGLSLAPLELLEECRRLRRDPTDEVILRSFNVHRNVHRN